MTQLLKNSYNIISDYSDKTVNFLKNSISISTDVVINGIKYKKDSTSEYSYYYYRYINVLLILLAFGIVYYLNTYYNHK